MSRLKRTALPVVLLALCLAPRQADASFISFQAGDYGGIVWDEVGDVSTMNNGCASTACNSSVLSALLGDLGPDFGVQFTNASPPGIVTLNSVRLIISLESPCASIAGVVECMGLTGLPDTGELEEDLGWASRDPNVVHDIPNSTQTLAVFTTTRTGDFFGLTEAQRTFIVGLSNPQNAHVGLDADFFIDQAQIPYAFTLGTAARPTTEPPPPASVPEPGTFALLAMGLGVAAMRSCRQGGAHVD